MIDVINAKKELDSDRISVGVGTCGLSAGAGPVYDALKKANLKIPVEKVGCSGMCYNEPIVTVVKSGKQSIYGLVTEDKVGTLIDCIKSGRVCKELLVGTSLDKIPYYKKQKRIVMKNCGFIDPLNIAQYMSQGGYGALKKAIELGQDGVLKEVEASGLRGRGGAGFPTARKWGFIAHVKGKKYLVANGDEGDPGAFMNRTLMESDPFKILEGMAIGAIATDCDEGFIYTRAEYPLAIKTLEQAICLARKHGFLGNNILGTKYNFDVSIRKGAGAFVCGEETALIHSIEGKRGNPSPRPPYPATKGVYGKPTSVNNIGTWGHVVAVLKYGAKQFRKVGTKKTPGTKVICLAGKINRAGIAEVPIGTTIKDIVYSIGGGMPKGTTFKAALTGGPAGGCVPKTKLNTRLDYEEMQKLGSIMGSGGIVVISNESCIVDIARYFMNFTQEESCGKCTPCREGTKRLLEMLERITRGEKVEILALRQLAEFVRDNSLCGLGQNAPNPILSTLRYFEKEYIEHINKHKCKSGVCKDLITYFITDKCIGCGMCAKNCPVATISGIPKERYFIHQEKCIKCGTCYGVCPVKAIIKK